MTDPSITCPNCKADIKLTELLASPLIEATLETVLKLAGEQI